MTLRITLLVIVNLVSLSLVSCNWITEVQKQFKEAYKETQIIRAKNTELKKDIKHVINEYKKITSDPHKINSSISKELYLEIEKLKNLSVAINILDITEISIKKKIEDERTVIKKLKLYLTFIEEEYSMLLLERNKSRHKDCFSLHPESVRPSTKPFKINGVNVLHVNKTKEDLSIVLTLKLKEQKHKLHAAKEKNQKRKLELKRNQDFFEDKLNFLIGLIARVSRNLSVAKTEVGYLRDRHKRSTADVTELLTLRAKETDAKEKLKSVVRQKKESLFLFSDDLSCYKQLEHNVLHHS